MVDQKVWKGGGVSLALFCLYRLSRQSGYNMCYFSPFPHWLRDLLSAIYPFQMFPPFAMNALNARIWTTKPLAPGPSHRKRLKSVYSFSLLRNLTLPLYRFALRLFVSYRLLNDPLLFLGGGAGAVQERKTRERRREGELKEFHCRSVQDPPPSFHGCRRRRRGTCAS